MKHHSKQYLDGVAVIFRTLNNEHDIGAALESIVKNQVDQVILVDGGSDDETVNIAKRHIDEVYVAERGLWNQQKFALSKVKYRYFIQAEADHEYPENFVVSLLSEFKESNFFGLQATLKCIHKRNFYERGISTYYQIHQRDKGPRDTIGGPSIYYTEQYKDRLDLKGFNGFSIDTMRAEILKAKGLTVALGHTLAYQNQTLNLPKFLRKYFSYGKGDYQFYQFHKKKWTKKRKFQSISHVFNRHFVDYPLKALKYRDPHITISYLWFSGLIRYAGWMFSVFLGCIEKFKRLG